MNAPILSDKGTLLVHVPSETLGLRGMVMEDSSNTIFVPKAEHHITVFGYRIGRLVSAAIKEEQALRRHIETQILCVNWDYRRRGFFFVLERVEPKPISTIIELVAAPISEFYREVALDVNPERFPELAAALKSPPPPHITLYTSDQKGVDGIGLDREDDLKMALNGSSKKLSARVFPFL